MIIQKFSYNPVKSFLYSRENKQSIEFDNHSDLSFDVYDVFTINTNEEIALFNFETFV